MAQYWHLQRKDRDTERVASADFRKLIQTGQLTHDSFLCRDDQGEPDGRWIAASTIGGLFNQNSALTKQTPISPVPNRQRPQPVPPRRASTVALPEPRKRKIRLILTLAASVLLVGILFTVNYLSTNHVPETPNDLSPLIAMAEDRLKNDHLAEAKRYVFKVLHHANSPQVATAEQLLHKIETRQAELNRSVDELLRQAKDALKNSDIPKARTLAEQAIEIDSAQNSFLAYEFIQSLPTNPAVLGDRDPNKSPLAWTEIVKKIKPSVVKIHTNAKLPSGHTRAGTGFVIADKLVITNYHVIEGATRVAVGLMDNSVIETDGQRHIDPARDIAIIHTEKKLTNIDPLPLLESYPQQLVEVVAMGHPLGFHYSMTKGVVSAIRDAPEIGPQAHFDGRWVQTDAAISSGNSGGPLFTQEGIVVGMNSLGISGEIDEDLETFAQNINLAISSVDILRALEEAKTSSTMPYPNKSAVP